MKRLPFFLILWIGFGVPLLLTGQDSLPDTRWAGQQLDLGRYKEAIEYCESWLPVIRIKIATDTSFQHLYKILGQGYLNHGQYDKAIRVFDELKILHGTNNGKEHPDYASDLNYLGECYFGLGDYKTALPFLEEALRIRKSILGTHDPDYATTINDLAVLYYSQGNYKAALPYFLEAAFIHKETLGPRHIDYAADLNNLALLYKKLGRYQEALPLLREAADIDKEVLGEKHPDYITDLNNLANLLSTLGKYDDALSLYEVVRKNRSERPGKMHTDYAKALNNLAVLIIRKGNYEAALPLYEEATEVNRQVAGELHPDFARSLTNQASLYKRLGRYESAIRLYEKASEIYRQSLGEKHPDYATALNNLGLLYHNIGNNKAALPLLLKAAQIDKEINGSNNLDFATDLNNLALVYFTSEQQDTALKLLEESASITRELLGTGHPDYAFALNSKARVLQSLGYSDSAIRIYKEASHIYRSLNNANHPDHAIVLYNEAVAFKEMGDFEAALPLLRESASIRQLVFGSNSPEYATVLYSMSGIYIALGKSDSALKMLQLANTTTTRTIQENFSFLSEDEKQRYFNTIRTFYEVYFSTLLKVPGADRAYLERAYNNELTLKGLILSSVSAMQKSILDNGDSALVKEYEEMRALKRRINALLQKPIADRQTDVSELAAQAEELEKDLISHSRVYEEMKEAYLIKWEDVGMKLEKNEAAIEFTSFRFHDNRRRTDSTYYCAFILKKYDQSPQIVKLFEKKQLLNLLPKMESNFREINSFYLGDNLYNLVWKPLEPYLEGITKVSFAPSGLLHSISLAAISCPDHKLLLEKYDLRQLSSTRTLVLTQTPVNFKNATVYGGITYARDSASFATIRIQPGVEANLSAGAGPYTNVPTRKGFRYLPGTLKEAEMVTSRLQQKGIVTSTLTGRDASEESFISLSGEQAPSLIHLSTHGFYYPVSPNEESRKRIDLRGSGEGFFRYSEDPLLRSGLLMAGANFAWEGGKVPEGVEDGVLTAKEVASNNLMKTVLVVLSACQTGQGEVKGSEGVEGLQRGFKIAGVRFLLMSLWEIPDKETTEFMNLFYDQLMAVNEIREAFTRAQQVMKSKYPAEPHKWAAFILTE